MSESRYRDALKAAREIGQAWRGDWSDFDGRSLRDQMDDLDTIADGTISLVDYRSAHGLCLSGGGHWMDYCHEECRAAGDTGGQP